MSPNRQVGKAVGQVIAAVERDGKLTEAPVLPIVHVPKLRQGGYDLTHLPTILKQIATELTPKVIAVAERELGAGIIARAKTVRAIRKALNELPFYQPLHLLGSGNPWTVAILAAAGADTFDGLEWCRVVIDSGGEADRTNHFQHFDFFEDQQSGVAIVDSVMREANIGFGAKVLFHNLEYFRGFSSYMQDMFKANSIEAFVHDVVGKKPTNKLKLQIPDFFA
jgi:queuine/archaeosine tRNA-ribosyltransferase